VAAAPHHHINGLEDLLLDQRSDSGTVVEAPDPGDAGVAIAPLRLEPDIPCLACFSRDFVSAPAPSVAFLPALFPLAPPPEPSPLGFPDRPSSETPSRAPPRIS